MENTIFQFIWRHSARNQLGVVALTFISFPILYLSLELPKWIINDALSTSFAPKSVLGWTLDAAPYLVLLCVSLLVLIVINGLLKMRINTIKGIIGERMVRRLRFVLIDRMLGFPIRHFSKVSQGELIATVTAETEPLAGYIGESIALPLFQGGTMLTILIFMFAQNWVLGLAAIALIPLQIWIIPKLQHQVNLLKKERVRRVRKLSERIGETVSGVKEIRLHGTQPYTKAEFSQRLGDLFWVRLEIFKKKFFMKFLNNTINQITPFMFYLLGGLLVINGELSIGALVAAIAAYKDLTSPWRELLNHYQAHEDAKVKYQQIREQFSPEHAAALTRDRQRTERRSPEASTAAGLHVQNLTVHNENGERTLSGVNFNCAPGESVAVIGDYPIRRAALADALTGLVAPSSGRIYIDNQELGELDEQQLRSQLGFLGPDPHIFSGTITDNIHYALNRRPPLTNDDDQGDGTLREARASGNAVELFDADWRDLDHIHAKNESELHDWTFRVAGVIGADKIMYERGLLEVFDPKIKPALSEKLLTARRELGRQFLEQGLDDVVMRFDPDLYNPHASVAENILYGVALDERLRGTELARQLCDLGVLDALNIRQRCIETGGKIAHWLLELNADAPNLHPMLSQFDIVDEDDLANLERLATQANRDPQSLTVADQLELIKLFLAIIVSVHGERWMDFRLMTRLVQCRREFAERLPAELAGAVESYDATRYHSRLTVFDNLLFGRMRNDDPAGARRVNEIVERYLEESGFKRDIMLLLSESQVGISGARLPTIAKQRIPLGRVLVKRPNLLIFQDALSAFDEQARRQTRERIRDLLPDVALVWIDKDVEHLTEFNRVYEFTDDGALGIRGGADEPTLSELPSTSTGVVDLSQFSDIQTILSHSAMFRMLEPSYQRYLASHSRVLQVKQDDELYQVGDEADAIYVVIHGQASAWRPTEDEPERVGLHDPGSVLGAIEVLAKRTRIFSIRAETDLKCVQVDADAIFDLIEKDGLMASAFLRAITEQWAPSSSAPQQRAA